MYQPFAGLASVEASDGFLHFGMHFEDSRFVRFGCLSRDQMHRRCLGVVVTVGVFVLLSVR